MTKEYPLVSFYSFISFVTSRSYDVLCRSCKNIYIEAYIEENRIIQHLLNYLIHTHMKNTVSRLLLGVSTALTIYASPMFASSQEASKADAYAALTA